MTVRDTISLRQSCCCNASKVHSVHTFVPHSTVLQETIDVKILCVACSYFFAWPFNCNFANANCISKCALSSEFSFIIYYFPNKTILFFYSFHFHFHFSKQIKATLASCNRNYLRVVSHRTMIPMPNNLSSSNAACIDNLLSPTVKVKVEKDCQSSTLVSMNASTTFCDTPNPAKEVNIDYFLDCIKQDDWESMMGTIEKPTEPTSRKKKHNVNTIVPLSNRPIRRQRVCFPALATRVYITTPTIANESMQTFAKRVGSSLHVLYTYNRQHTTDAVLPEQTCLMTWEHSCHTASCFEVLVEEHSPLQMSTSLTSLICLHTSNIHYSIGSNRRIANDCEFTPTHVQLLSTHLQQQQQHNTITLTSKRTFQELKDEDTELQIRWDVIAKHQQQYPAVFKNTRDQEYTFFFQKFLQNGNCKGIQRNNNPDKNCHTYLNSAGVSLRRLFYRAGDVLPTNIQTKQQSIASCDEPCVKLHNVYRHSFATIYDCRELYTTSSTNLQDNDVKSGCIYTDDVITCNSHEVGVWTTQNGWLCYTMYSSLPRIIIKKI